MKNMDAFVSFTPSRTFAQNGGVPIKNTFSAGISRKGAGKTLLVKIKNKNDVANLEDIVNVTHFNGKVSIQNLCANQVNKLLVYNKSW